MILSGDLNYNINKYCDHKPTLMTLICIKQFYFKHKAFLLIINSKFYVVFPYDAAILQSNVS